MITKVPSSALFAVAVAKILAASGEGPSGFSFSERRVRPAAGAKLVAAAVRTDDNAKPLNAAPPNSFRLVIRDVRDGPYSTLS
jgi:hypothetical protein